MFAWSPLGRRRIGRSLDRIDEELRLSREQHREAMAEFRALSERMAAAHAAQLAESHEFMREITREVRAAGNAQVRAMNALTESIGEMLSDLRAETRTELRDLREESRAQRQALLRLIDRLGPSPGGATA